MIIANAGRTRLVQIGLKRLVAADAAVEWHIVMSGVVLAAIPPLVLLVLLQSSLIQGVDLNEEK